MSPLSSPVRVLPRGRPKPTPEPTIPGLPHWSHVPSDESPSEPPIEPPIESLRVSSGSALTRPTPQVAPVLRDLAIWGAEIAMRLTKHCPEDVEAIVRVRDCALAWLAGEVCPEVELADVLTTAAAVMSSMDPRVNAGTEDERAAIGAPVDA